ncbi:hypothetical protein DV736_g4813, partial [Chaetothyriales sp. CBS 134916]
MPMQSAAIRPLMSLPLSLSLLGGHVCTACRRSALQVALVKQPGLRPLHASPIFQRPRRRDFFSSNAVLSHKKDDFNDFPHYNHRRPVRDKEAAPESAPGPVAVPLPKRKTARLSEGEGIEQQEAPKLVTAYAVAETFDVAKVIDILRSNGYEPDPLHTRLYPQVVHVQVPISSLYRSSGLSAAALDPADVGDVFIFPSGTLVTWALPEGFTSYLATRTLLPAATNPHTEPIETEDLEYVEDPRRETSSVRGDTFILGTKPLQLQPDSPDSPPSPVDTVLTKIAFSSGFARSTKLAVLETMLNTYLASTASIPSILAKGSRLPFRFSRSFILRKTGQLLQLRAQLNLYSELTDSLPDLFWDSRHELNLENYYDQVGRALDVGIRIKVLNEKMDYAAEIASVLRERLSEKHGTFLEWTIIVLIAIEVGFEVLRLRKEGFWQHISTADNATHDEEDKSAMKRRKTTETATKTSSTTVHA